MLAITISPAQIVAAARVAAALATADDPIWQAGADIDRAERRPLSGASALNGYGNDLANTASPANNLTEEDPILPRARG
jgi:hypothetical protein